MVDREGLEPPTPSIKPGRRLRTSVLERSHRDMYPNCCRDRDECEDGDWRKDGWPNSVCYDNSRHARSALSRSRGLHSAQFFSSFVWSARNSKRCRTLSSHPGMSTLPVNNPMSSGSNSSSRLSKMSAWRLEGTTTQSIHNDIYEDLEMRDPPHECLIKCNPTEPREIVAVASQSSSTKSSNLLRDCLVKSHNGNRNRSKLITLVDMQQDRIQHLDWQPWRTKSSRSLPRRWDFREVFQLVGVHGGRRSCVTTSI